MRLRTKKIADDRVRHSYYVSFLLWLGQSLFDRGESIAHKHFDD